MGKKKRYPSIFEEILRRMRREMERGFRFFGKEGSEQEFIDPFDQMMRRLEEEMPKEAEDFISEEETPSGKVQRFGPFVYGFSYTKKPGEEPEFQEFGNVRPSRTGEIEPTPEGVREPLTEVIDLNGKYEITIEVPGVKKEEIDLSATEDSMKVETTGDKKYKKEVSFEEPVNPEKVDANFRHGVLSAEIEKKQEEEGREKNIEIK